MGQVSSQTNFFLVRSVYILVAFLLGNSSNSLWAAQNPTSQPSSVLNQEFSMSTRRFLRVIISAEFLILGGCVSTSQIMEIGRDTYSVSATADGFRSAASARDDAFSQGAQKCASLGKKFLLTNESTARTRMGIDTTVSVNFRCLAENDPEYARPIIHSVPDVVIEDRRSK